MSKPEFNCDREWWSSLTEKEQEHWLDWAESCGADREANLVGRNNHYTDLICMPSVSLGIVNLSDEELKNFWTYATIHQNQQNTYVITQGINHETRHL